MKYNAPVWPNDYVVRTVEFLAFVMVREDLVFSVGSYFDDGAQYAGTVDQPMLAVEGVAIGIAECNHFFLFAVRIDGKSC